MAFYAPGPSVTPEPLNSTLPLPPVSPGRALTVPDVGDEHREPPHPIALGDGRHDGGGVGSRPGRAGHSAAGAGRRGPGGKDPKQRGGAQPAGGEGGLASGRAGGRAAGRGSAPGPSPPVRRPELSASHWLGLLPLRLGLTPRFLSHWPLDKGTLLRLAQWPAISVRRKGGEGALPERREEFGYVRWDRPLRAAGSDANWIRRREGLT